MRQGSHSDLPFHVAYRRRRVTLAEDVGENHWLNSFFDALWWSTTTNTTVGYGDVSPETTAGRLVGAVTMVVGISTFAVVSSQFAEFHVRSPSSNWTLQLARLECALNGCLARGVSWS
jgi:hypothetical protein